MKFKAPIEVESSLVDSSNSSGSAGQVLTSTGVGVDWIDPTLLPAESAEKVIQTVRFGEAVSKGDPLVITGYHGSNGPAIVERADATDATKMPAYGVALEDYANNATGLMIAVGDFNDFDTSSYSVSDTLYVAVGGGMTNVKPTGTALIQNMGIVSRSNANNGDVEIVAIGRANDVPNLPTGRLFVGTATNTSLISDVVYVDDANDRVGIGTTSPDSLLEIASDSVTDFLKLTSTGGGSTPIKLIFEKSTSEQGIIEYNRNGDLEIYNTDADGGVMIDGSASEGADLYVANTGNVGIGTNSPSAKLEVNGGEIRTTRENVPANYLSLSTTSAGSFIKNTGGTSKGLTFDNVSVTSPYINFKLLSSEAMRITSTGNVGIGTTSPSDKLQVNQGSDSFRGITIEGTSPALYLKDTQATNAHHIGSNGNYLYFLEDSNQSGTYNNIMAYWDPSNNFIFNTGNVGIGTTSPGSKLEVQGGDIEVDDSASGLILKSPDGTRYRITVANGGTLTVTAV